MANYTSFLQDFFDGMVDIIQDNGKEGLAPVDFYPALNSMREALFKKYDIRLDSVDEDALVGQLPNYVKDTLDDIELAHQDFVDVVFLKKSTLEEKPLVEYIKNIHKNDDWAVGLYHFQGLLNEKGCSVRNFRDTVIACFEGMKEGQRFELLSNIAVFMEAYAQTHEGREFLKNDFTMDKPQDSFRELFRRMNNASVFNAVAVKNDKNGKLKCQYTSGAGGEFDGLYIFPDDKGGLMVKQVQISATSNMGSGIEKNSVFRHAIANVIIARALDNALVNHNKTWFEHIENHDWIEHPDLTVPFKISPKDYRDEKFDILQEQKQKALLDIMKEYYPGSFGNAKSFGDLVTHLNANLHDYIYDCFREKPPLKAYAVIDAMNELKHVDVSNVFIAKTTYNGHPEYKNSTLGNMLGNTVDLNMREFRHGLQLVGISTFNRDNRGNEMFSQNEGLKVAFSGILSRCIDYSGKVDPTKLNKLGQDEFEKILFENFIFQNEEDIQKNYDVIGNKEVKVALNDYIHFIVLGKDDNGDIYDKKINDLGFNERQSLKETCEKLSNIKFLDDQSYLSEKIGDRLRTMKLEDDLMEADLERLNTALELGAGEVLFRNNEELLKLYKYFDKNNYDGIENKVFSENYKNAKKAVKTKKKSEQINKIKCAENIDVGLKYEVKDKEVKKNSKGRKNNS
jgi:hypothetical protein